MVRYPLIESLLLSEADNASTANVNSGNYCLNEVDNANLPRDFTEMQDFVYFYECVVKWAVCFNHERLYALSLLTVQ